MDILLLSIAPSDDTDADQNHGDRHEQLNRKLPWHEVETGRMTIDQDNPFSGGVLDPFVTFSLECVPTITV